MDFDQKGNVNVDCGLCSFQYTPRAEIPLIQICMQNPCRLPCQDRDVKVDR